MLAHTSSTGQVAEGLLRSRLRKARCSREQNYRQENLFHIAHRQYTKKLAYQRSTSLPKKPANKPMLPKNTPKGT